MQGLTKYLAFLFFVIVAISLLFFFYFQQTLLGIRKERGLQNSSSAPTFEVKEKNLESEEIEIEATEFRFSPSEISLKEGTKLILHLKNTGQMPHDFVIDELQVRSRVLNPGETERIEIRANRKGTFSFYCSIGNHRFLGMEGKVVVD